MLNTPCLNSFLQLYPSLFLNSFFQIQTNCKHDKRKRGCVCCHESRFLRIKFFLTAMSFSIIFGKKNILYSPQHCVNVLIFFHKIVLKTKLKTNISKKECSSNIK